MGCSNGKMTKVAPQLEKHGLSDAKSGEDLKNDSNLQIRKNSGNRRAESATSKFSRRSDDSAFIEGDTDSILTSTGGSTRASSGGLKRTLKSLSAKSRGSIEPRRQEEGDILSKLRSEGFLESDTHKAKSGLSFELVESTDLNRPRSLPVRLRKLERRLSKRKLLTQQDIENKLQNAERRRKEAEAERLGKIQSVTVKSDIHNALDNFAERQKQVKEHVQEKVDTATENRAKKLREMRDKLRAKEEHATHVRQRKKTLVPIKIQDNGDELPSQQPVE